MQRQHRLFLTSFIFALPALAGEANGLFKFFGGRDIDYWNEEKKLSFEMAPRAKDTSEATSFSGSSVVRASDIKPFDWKNYQDPRSPEFWDDGGDWIPPRPFREAAAQPNTKNIEEYLAWQGRKTAVLTRLQEAMAAQAPNSRGTKEVEAKLPWNEFKIAYFYQTACPHCRSSAASIEKARELGAAVTFVQLDYGTEPPLHTPSIPYDSEWSGQFPVTSTPTWVFSFRGKTAKHTGAIRLADLKAALTSLWAGEKK